MGLFLPFWTIQINLHWSNQCELLAFWSTVIVAFIVPIIVVAVVDTIDVVDVVAVFEDVVETTSLTGFINRLRLFSVCVLLTISLFSLDVIIACSASSSVVLVLHLYKFVSLSILLSVLWKYWLWWWRLPSAPIPEPPPPGKKFLDLCLRNQIVGKPASFDASANRPPSLFLPHACSVNQLLLAGNKWHFWTLSCISSISFASGHSTLRGYIITFCYSSQERIGKINM